MQVTQFFASVPKIGGKIHNTAQGKTLTVVSVKLTGRTRRDSGQRSMWSKPHTEYEAVVVAQ